MAVSQSVFANGVVVNIKDELSRLSAQLALEQAELEKSERMGLEEWVRSGSKKIVKIDDGISLG